MPGVEDPRHRALFESSPMAIAYHEMLYDEDGHAIDYRFLDVNAMFVEIMGIDPHGKTVREVFPGIEQDPFDWIGTYAKVVETGEVLRFEQHLELNDRWYDCTAYRYEPARFVVAFLDQTERKRTEAALRESEDKFKYIFEHSVVPKSITRPDGRISVNQAFCDLIGYTHDELTQSATWQQITHPDDFARTQGFVDAILAGEMDSARFEKRYIRKDGRTVWVDLSTSLRRNADGTPCYFITTLLDVTEQRRMQAELAETHALLQGAMDASPIGIVIADAPDGRLRYVNDAGLLIGGKGKEDLVDGVDAERYVAAWHLVDMDGRTLEADEIPLAQAIRRGVKAGREFMVRRPDGEDRVVLANAAPILDAQGDVIAAIGVFADITDRKRAEMEVVRLNQELEERVQARTEELTDVNEELTGLNEELIATNEELAQTNEELAEANELLGHATQAKNEFLAAMSHELRTPLNSIIGFSGILESGLAGPLSDEQQRQIEMINRAGQHLLGLINEVLDLSRIESGGTRPAFETVDILSVAAEALETVRPLATEKALGLRLLSPEASALVTTDPHFVMQILLNLLGNAIKFTEMGSVTLALTEGPAEIRLAVTDTGPGIAPDDLERIFDDFYQATPLNGVKHEGTGLGLPVSQRLVELLGGSIHVESTVGSGSTFTLVMPKEPADGETTAERD